MCIKFDESDFSAVVNLIDKAKVDYPELDLKLKNYVYGKIIWPKVLGSAFSLDRADSFTIEHTTITRSISLDIKPPGKPVIVLGIPNDEPEPTKWYNIDESTGNNNVVEFMTIINPDLIHYFRIRKSKVPQWNRPVPNGNFQFMHPEKIKFDPSPPDGSEPSNLLQPFYLIELERVRDSYPRPAHDIKVQR